MSDSKTSVPDTDAAKASESECPVTTPAKQGGTRMVHQEVQKDLETQPSPHFGLHEHSAESACL